MTEQSPETTEAARAALHAVRTEVAKAVVGQDAAVTGLVIALLARGHVLLEGVPGVAKTLLVRALSAALSLETARVQFTPDLMPGDVTGSLVYDARTAEFSFREGPVFTNLLLADEINRTPPKTQASLLEAMEERQVTVDGQPRKLPEPFVVAATQNPVEYEGTYPLPEAQLDRFLLKLTMPIPPREDEIQVLDRHARGFDPRDLRAAGVTAVAGPSDLAHATAAVRRVQIHPEVIGYVVDLARATRVSPSLSLGVSPRGATALLATSRAWAWLAGRDYVSPDDVKALARPTLRHRLSLRPEAELEGVSVESVLDGVLASVPVPADGTMAFTGRSALLALAGAVALVIAPGWPVFLGWIALVAVLVAIDLWRAGSPKSLVYQRLDLSSVRLGGTVESTLTVTNAGARRVRGVLRDAWQPSAGAHVDRHSLDVPPGERRRLVTVLTPTRRGDRLADRITVRSLGPMGLAARQRSVAVPGRLRALPPFGSRRHLPSRLARLRELDGRTSVNVRGQGTEFDSLREYVVGDDVRSIDWRATARSQTVAVRTWRPERDRRVLLVLDTSRTSAGRVDDAPRLDAAMDAALLLSALASRAGDRVDLLAADRRVRASVQGVTGAALLPALVDAMAPLEPELLEADWFAIVGAIRARTNQRCLVVLLTALESASVEEGLLPVLTELTGRHQVVIASVADPAVTAMAAGRSDADQVYAAAAAERTLTDRTRLAALLSRLGVEVVDADPEHLPPALADRYLALKAAGRL